MTYIINLALKNVVAASTAHTSVQNAGEYGHNDSVTGSLVTYTPTSSATKIIYEISFYLLMDNDEYLDHNMNYLNCINVEQSTNNGVSWTTVENDFARNTGCAVPSGTTHQSVRQQFYCSFILPAWSGTRMLRAGFTQAYSWGKDSRLHKLYKWDGATTSTKYVNTSVCVHEI